MTRTRDEQLSNALAHAAAEGDGDLEATMATLDAEPVYELQPMGRLLVGRDRARRYYEWFFPNFMPRVAGFEIRNEWVNDDGLAQEYTMWVRAGDDPAAGPAERFEIIGILLFGETGLAGERLYASEAVLRLMLGPLYDETVPIPSQAP
jgi:SnoaL-like protein